MDAFAQIAKTIIEEQEKIIGPIALEQAKKVQGISLNWDKHEVALNGNEKEILENLVKQYGALFGKASIEVCKEVTVTVTDKIVLNQLPDILKS